MPKFEVQAVLRLEVAAQLTVSAKDEDQADYKVKTLISEGKIGLKWEGFPCVKPEVT